MRHRPGAAAHPAGKTPQNHVDAALEFFVTTVLVCMAMELAMGFLLNQPDAAGNYPLCQKALAKVPIRIMRPIAAIVVVGFVVLCVVKFS